MEEEPVKLKEYIEGFRCETCSEERVFGSPPNSDTDNLYIYIDLSGSTRCFCKKHMNYGKEGSPALLDFNDKWDYPIFGAKLISEIL